MVIMVELPAVHSRLMIAPLCVLYTKRTQSSQQASDRHLSLRLPNIGKDEAQGGCPAQAL